MLLNIQHETVYRYSTPVDYTIQHLRLTPRHEAQQQPIDWKISAPGKYQRHLDAYGNVGHILVLDKPHEEIRITVNGQVEIAKENAHLPSDGGEVPLLAYLQPTMLTTADIAIQDLAKAACKSRRGGVDSMFKLIDGIQQAVAYVPGTTQVTSTAAEVLAAGTGVCQDHAHLFIACCRALDLPARYVSGYIHPGDTDHAASHAWADVWLEGQGWVSFDITNANFAASEHCRLAVGRDYLDACPVRGVRHGGGAEAMEVMVRIAHPDSAGVLLQSLVSYPPREVTSKKGLQQQ
jgi:transglutaminase-like putative cysteine protease